MDDDLVVGVVCSECGLDPFDVKSEADEAGGYRLRVRRRALWVWLLVLFVLGVIGSPWVQVRLGNRDAIWGYNEILPAQYSYVPLADPPVRWRDLVRAADGDADSIKQFQKAAGVFILRDTALPKEYESYSFEIGRPDQTYQFGPDSGYVGEFEGEDFAYTLRRYESETIGWPIGWVYHIKNYSYAYGDRRFGEDRLLSVEGDMIEVLLESKRYLWGNILYVGAVCFVLGLAAWKVCLIVGVARRRSMVVGLIASGLAVGVVLVVGSQYRVVYDEAGLTGGFSGMLGTKQRDWDRVKIEAMLLSDEQTRVLAQSLIEDFGEMIHPNELVVCAMGRRVGPRFEEYEYGLWGFNLLRAGSNSYWRSEQDGALTQINFPLQPSVKQAGVQVGFGSVEVWWRGGVNRLDGYGVSVFNRSVLLASVGMYVLWRAMVLVGGLWYRWVQRRRARRGGCVWCGYPCG